MRNTKRSAFTSVICLLLCCTMLLGTTYAWFTATRSSANNIVQSGNLDIEMYWSDSLLEATSTEWKKAEGAIFTHENWEPGYTDVKYVKIANEGSLALQWKLNITAEGAMTALADVIDVYYVNPVSETLTSLSGLTSEGVLSEVVELYKTTGGVLLPAGESSTEYNVGYTIMAIALHMDETAGNDLQETSIGDGFSINLMATQFSYENDGFNSSYDEDAEWPDELIVGENTVSANVNTNAQGEVTEPLTMSVIGGNYTANVPAGVLMANGASRLTLTVNNIAGSQSQANVSLEATEETRSIDVHIAGVSPDNTVVIAVSFKELLPVGLNMGNYRFYHVENSQTVEMTLLADGATPVHNNFEYDPATGDVVLHLATFSEVALVADTENAWEGEFDYTWYDASKPELTIANADQLAAFGAIVGGMAEGIEQDSFSGKTVKLIADVNLGDAEAKNNPDLIFYPIGYYNNAGSYDRVSGGSVTSTVYSFEGTFDGNGNTVSNFYQNTWEMFGDYNSGYSGTPNYYKDAMGLFGYVVNGTVKNLTVDHFSSDGEFTPTGVIAAYAVNSTFENIAITNCNPRVYNTGNGGIVGVGGNTDDANDKELTFTNITVDNTNMISALWGSWDVACGGIMGMFRGNGLVHFENCNIGAQIDVYNDVCGNYQYYWYRYSGMVIGSIRGKNITDGNGYTVPDTTGITANNSTVHFGTWNDYYYCELVANSLASYTHDHQFSRLTKISSINEIKTGDTWTKAGNFLLDGACYHIVNDNGTLRQHSHEDAGTEVVNGETVLKEDKQIVYLPFNQLIQGDGWGVKTIGFRNDAEYNEELFGFKILDRDEANSIKKFEAIANGNSYTSGTGLTLTVGDIFKAVTGANINTTTLRVFVSPIGEDNTISAEYTAADKWNEGKIAFSGFGSAKIVITDYTYCKETVAVITINEPAKSPKFEAKEGIEKGAYSTISLGDIFDKINTATLGNVTATIVAPNNNETIITATESDWAGKTITLTQTGTWSIKITDDDRYCAETSTTIEVVKADKFTNKFTGDFLYRVGNQNAVSLGTIFEENETPVKLSSASVQIETVAGNASGTYTSNPTWTNGTIQFTGTGVVKVTISADGANPVELDLEVIDAVNATTATNAKSNNVVLLNDCGFGSLEVTDGYTLYGNGFTMTCGSDSAALDFGYSFVTLTNGTLDNVQIVTPNYDYAALYKSNLTSSENRSQTTDKTRYYNAKSAVMVSGNSQILNSRISGARAAVNVTGGNLLIDNSRIEGGAVASILVGAANSLTLRDVTLIQKPTVSTYDSNKTLMGFSVLYMCDSNGYATPTTLEGTLIQQAWVNADDKKYVPSAGQDIVDGVMKETAFIHNIGGKDSLNLGFAYLPESTDNTVNTPNNITDHRTDKDTVPYEMKAVSIQIAILKTTVYVYSYKNTKGTVDSFKTESAYTPNKYGDFFTVDYTDTNENRVLGKVFGENGWVYQLAVDLDQGAYTFDFSKLTVQKNGGALGINRSDKVSVEEGTTEYTLTLSDGSTIVFKLIGTATTKDAPQWSNDANGTTLSTSMNASWENGLCVASKKGGTWHGAAPALQNVYIRYYSTEAKTYKVIHLADYTPKVTGKVNGSNTTCTITGPDFTLTLTGGQVHSGNNVYAIPVVCEGKLYFLPATSSGLVNSGNSARTVPVSYSFTDGFGNTLTGSHTWSVAEDQNNEYSYDDFCNGTKTAASSGSSGCVTPDTLITLADGSQVRVDSLTGDELLLVWNMETGMLDYAPIMFLDSDPTAEYEVIKLYFSDGTEVKVIYEHGFWDYDLNKYVYLDANAADYIGHTFAKQNGDVLEQVTLVDVVIETEVTTAWSPVTVGHLCYFVNGMLSMPGGVGGLFNIFEVDPDTMTYDYEALARDIETYGLYTYEELNAICPLSEDMFNAAGGAYLKISIGKGNMTEQELYDMINRYSKFFD